MVHHKITDLSSKAPVSLEESVEAYSFGPRASSEKNQKVQDTIFIKSPKHPNLWVWLPLEMSYNQISRWGWLASSTWTLNKTMVLHIRVSALQDLTFISQYMPGPSYALWLTEFLGIRWSRPTMGKTIIMQKFLIMLHSYSSPQCYFCFNQNERFVTTDQ